MTDGSPARDGAPQDSTAPSPAVSALGAVVESSREVTVSLPDRYVGGTYLVEVAAVGSETATRTSAMIAVEPGSPAFGVETVTDAVDYPWGIEFLPDGSTLVATERDAGTVLLVDRDDGTATTVDGTPGVYRRGQGCVTVTKSSIIQ